MKSITKIMGVGVLLLLLVAAPFFNVRTASAAAGNPAYCDAAVPALTNQNIGSDVPVVMVHGWNGDGDVWGAVNDSASFAGTVNNIPGVAVAHLFDYNWVNWVDHPESGPLLAKTIDCVSQLSVHQGGKGKVIVVGYSMGGLVARDALSRKLADGRSVADVAGQAITIGSPHAGTVNPYGYFTPGLPWITNLPHFPSQTIVHTIAGDVTRIYYDQQGKEIRREYPSDDTLVGTGSAHDNYRYDSDPEKGGGKKTFGCQQKYRSYIFFSVKFGQPAICQHDRLISEPTNGVRDDTVAAIEKYVASLNAASTKSLTIGSLTTTFDNRWTNVDYGAAGPGQDGSARDMTNGAPCSNCQDVPPPTVHAFMQIEHFESGCGDSTLQCALAGSPLAGEAPAVTIGGRTPDVSARYYDSGYQGTSMVWCFETEKICVYYRRAVNAPQLELSQAALDVFGGATWSS